MTSSGSIAKPEREGGQLYIGGEITPTSGDPTGAPSLIDAADLTTHAVIVGMTGSGKTGLGVVLLEEALNSGIPVLAIDPKGDLGNLALTFPDLEPSDFEPWMDEGAARVKDTTVAELATKTAARWRSGLATWGLDGDDLAKLKQAASTVIYTPGSTAGVPINALGRLSAPPTNDPSERQDEVDATVSGLLGLIGVASDPLSGREHILMANLITRAWDSGIDLDLSGLLGQLLDPPIRKLGVLELDTFFPPKDRQKLVLKLNGLLASPSFAAWAEGEPLDMDTMLWGSDGKPRAAVVSLGHLDEAERQFAITLVLSRLISWMRSQSGTGELRVLVYIDEVMGLAPPTANPPTKKPILTLLKQARAFGVGLVLSTQNPVDLDYKAISNAGTWLIGRLQTAQDKNRLVDGLRSSAGGVDVVEVERMISGLDKRQFVLRSSRNGDLPLLTTRWAMNYLAGPLTSSQIGSLMAEYKAALVGDAGSHTSDEPGSGTPASPASPGSASNPASPGSPASPASTASPASPASTASTANIKLADDESPVLPAVPDSIPVRYLHQAAPWGEQVSASPGSLRLQAALAARLNLLFDDTKAKLRHSEEWEAIIPLTGSGIDVDSAISVDFDDRDFITEAPSGARYVLPAFDLSVSAIRSAKSDLKKKLYADEVLMLANNASLKLWSRPGETSDEFASRCEMVAADGADAATAKLRAKLEKKYDQVQIALAKAEDRVAELETQAKGRKTQNLINIGSSILGGLMGGRRRNRSLAASARRMASGSRQSGSIESRLDSAQNRVAEKIETLDQLEADLADAVIEIDDEWTEKASDIEPVAVPLEKTDISIDDFILVWLPVAG